MKQTTRRNFLKITATAGGLLAGGAGLNWLLDSRLEAQVSETRLLMGTVVNLTLTHSDRAEAEAIVSATFAEMERLATIFDYRQAISPLAQLNQRGTLVSPPTELRTVLARSMDISARTAGAFDVSIKPVLDQVKAGNEVDSVTRALVDYRKIDLKGETISFGTSGMALTLDGIAKGQVVDGGVALLKANGFNDILVEAGGDLIAYGGRADGGGWRIAVQNPRPELRDARYLGVFSLNEGAVATSGDYVETFTTDHSLHHILDPHTDRSPEGLASVTVIAPEAIMADALSTAIMVLGPADGLDLVASLPDVEALLVSKELRLMASAGFPFRK